MPPPRPHAPAHVPTPQPAVKSTTIKKSQEKLPHKLPEALIKVQAHRTHPYGTIGYDRGLAALSNGSFSGLARNGSGMCACDWPVPLLALLCVRCEPPPMEPTNEPLEPFE